VEDSQIQEVIDSMFREAGMATKQTLTFDDFNKLLRDYKEQLDHANLNFIGLLSYGIYWRHRYLLSSGLFLFLLTKF